MDEITLLTPAESYLQGAVGKTHRCLGDTVATAPYSNVKHWLHSVFEFGGFDELCDVLSAVEAHGQHIAIRGALNAGVDDLRPVLRRLHDDGDEKATFHP